jgi:hypothetical protein
MTSLADRWTGAAGVSWMWRHHGFAPSISLFNRWFRCAASRLHCTTG